MRFVLLAFGVLAFGAAIEGRAMAQNYPWCAVYDMGDAAYSCSFVSAEQCWNSVHGIGGYCTPNNTYQPTSPIEPHPYGRD